jgi:predicted HAD superfamily phosphohydrolase YqeG
VRTVYEHATGLSDAARRARELSARTVIFDVEPLVTYWNGTQEDLDEGIARVLSEIAKVPTVEVVCFSTNSVRRPSAMPSSAGVRVVYLASAGKPLRTTAYQRFPRPGVVIGDQVATDGILARRLGYAFILVDRPAGAPVGPRLMAAAGRLVHPLLFTNPPAQSRRLRRGMVRPWFTGGTEVTTLGS